MFRISCICGTRQFGMEDLVDAYEAYVERSRQLGGRVLNMGWRADFHDVPVGALPILEKQLGRTIPVSFGDWRPADQKVYISEVRKTGAELGWGLKVRPDEGVQRILASIQAQPFAKGGLAGNR